LYLDLGCGPGVRRENFMAGTTHVLNLYVLVDHKARLKRAWFYLTQRRYRHAMPGIEI
jgi:hypothetical protein